MVTHIVLFKLKDPSPENLRLTAGVLSAMDGKIPELVDIEVGIDQLKSERSFDIALRTLTLWPFLLGFACYGISLVIWIVALSRVPVTVAYPMLSIGYVINAFIAWQWFGEALAAQKLLGIGFIVVGVFLVARS